jgi:hypothetical protein
MGLVAMQLHVGDGDYEDVAALIRLRAKIAKLIFETEWGRYRYLMGAALFHDTAGLFSREEIGIGVTSGPFMLPVVGMPYLPRVLRLNDVDLCREDANNIIDGRVRFNEELAGVIAAEDNDDTGLVAQSLADLACTNVPIDPLIV